MIKLFEGQLECVPYLPYPGPSVTAGMCWLAEVFLFGLLPTYFGWDQILLLANWAPSKHNLFCFLLLQILYHKEILNISILVWWSFASKITLPRGMLYLFILFCFFVGTDAHRSPAQCGRDRWKSIQEINIWGYKGRGWGNRCQPWTRNEHHYRDQQAWTLPSNFALHAYCL